MAGDIVEFEYGGRYAVPEAVESPASKPVQ
jgi:hypothetical protein